MGGAIQLRMRSPLKSKDRDDPRQRRDELLEICECFASCSSVRSIANSGSTSS